jgi:hypothetical protein
VLLEQGVDVLLSVVVLGPLGRPRTLVVDEVLLIGEEARVWSSSCLREVMM